MYIQGRIIAENTLTTVLPDDAIVSENEKSYIFVKIGGEDHDHGHEETDGAEERDLENHAAEENHGEEDAHVDHDDHADEPEEGAWKFEMVEVMTGFSNDGFTEIKLLQPLPKGAEIAGVGAYYLLAEMGKGETEHSH
jgi:cobalt-zinc-cadmium efflux system membrane fusion protein